jgi:DNA-binding transcriptional regulator YiaG
MTVAGTNFDPKTPREDTSFETELADLDPKSVRETAGLSLSEMAELLGMSESGYGLWEKRTRRPGGPAYRRLFLLSKNPDNVIMQLTGQS